MRLKFTLQRSVHDSDDLLATFDSSATVGDLATYLSVNDPVAEGRRGTGKTLRLVNRGDVVLEPNVPLTESALRSGDVVALTSGGAGGPQAPKEVAATMTLVGGPGAGTEYSLPAGTSVVGRENDCDVILPDPLVSRRHARINVADVVEILDLGSANGTLVGEATTSRALLRPSDTVQLGDTTLQVRLVHQPAAKPSADIGSAISFVRSPVLTSLYDGRALAAPQAPERPRRQRLPFITLVTPLLLGAAIFALTRSPASLVFVALSPLMLIGSTLESRRHARADYREAVESYEEDLAGLRAELEEAHREEVAGRAGESPASEELVRAASARTPVLWSRRHDLGTFSELRVGLGQMPSRTTVEPARGGRAAYDLLLKATTLIEDFTAVGPVPVTVRLDRAAVGVCGPRRAVLDHARSLLVQATVLHSPSELAVAGFFSRETASDWEWLTWLPHVSSVHSPLKLDHLAATQSSGNALVSALEELVARRGHDYVPGPVDPPVVVVVESDPPVDHNRLVELAESGPARGVYVVWVANHVSLLPAACKTFVSADISADEGVVGQIADQVFLTPVALDVVTARAADEVARALAPVVDLGARAADASDLPRSITQLTLIGEELAEQPHAVIERWRESNSLLTGPYAPAELPRRAANLRAVIGQSASGAHTIDLRTDGPHALVGGTTGSGKSELLQSWVLALAAGHSAERVNFLFVDYKGGAAFAECEDLPHSIGVVTDLSQHLVRRALKSLTAELRYREELLRRHHAKDLVQMERMGSAAAPPSLIIVVDEFAALVHEVPEFVDGVVNVAQRGRSLGLHLVLATQRPTGVIKENLRANTNLRIALRMADADDSTDVLGTPAAAAFDPGVPGRAVSKSGPRRLVPFQATYSGGWSSSGIDGPEFAVQRLSIADPSVWERRDAVPEEATDDDATDIKRLVRQIVAAHAEAGLGEPRRAWLPELPALLDLRRLQPSTTDRRLVIGASDDPDRQAQPEVDIDLDREGNVVVYGTSGAGKSTALRTVAVAAGTASPQTPVHIYALDFASRSLGLLEDLPHVGSVVGGNDHERVVRTLRMFRQAIDERVTRYSSVNAATLTDYRTRAARPGEPRLVLLVDGLTAFRQAYETSDRQRWVDLLGSILAEGRSVGVHVVLTSDQRAGLTTAMSASVQRRIVLRMASLEDYSMLGVPQDVLGAGATAGRALDLGQEMQVGLLGSSADVLPQVEELKALAAALRKLGVAETPPVGRLAEAVSLAALPAPDGRVWLGLDSESLEPLAIEPSGSFLIAGPVASGRTTTLRTLLEAVEAAQAGRPRHLLTRSRSALADAYSWRSLCRASDDVGGWASTLAAELTALDDSDPRHVIILESAGDHASSMAEMALQQLVKVAVSDGHWVIAEGESSTLGYGAGFLGTVKASRTGVVLQPDQESGSSLFKTAFPRIQRTDFPVGRGIYVIAGRHSVVQVAAPWAVAADG